MMVGGADLAMKGSVENQSAMRVADVRLRIESLAADGRVLGESFGYVKGDVVECGRVDFLILVSVPGAAYRVTVVSFDGVAGPTAPSASPPGPR